MYKYLKSGKSFDFKKFEWSLVEIDRTNPDKTVFVFKRTPEFEEAFAQINKEIAETKAAEEVL